MGKVELALCTFCLLRCADCDVYLHNPRGSNNKLSEQNNNANNQNRLFDSQNNAAGGYQIGDSCKPVCQDNNNNYDETKPGAMKGRMSYYKGSQLYIEWTNQHSCGVDNKFAVCQIILQYMCGKDNPGLRDGTKRGNQNNAGGQNEPPDSDDVTLGQHEPLQHYLDCSQRDRNRGLYTADQNVRNDRGATATRQNNNGNNNANDRNGLECPEERDYYPYWHPTPWHDIAILTDEPHARCQYYQQESQNVKGKNYCTVKKYNNKADCESNKGAWETAGAFNEPKPECIGAMADRDNHLGNGAGGKGPSYYLWTIPQEADGVCVLRLRYNITTGDFAQGAKANTAGPATIDKEISDYFFVDSSFNDPNPGDRRRRTFNGAPTLLAQDPVADWVGLGSGYLLQLQVNTNQYGRTFQDRTHTFNVDSRPSSVLDTTRIVNYNVRGRRGNIVQVYPSVEYDFVPSDLQVEQGTLLHFQWAGSDANNNNNAGNGRQGTDRSNLVQLKKLSENVPVERGVQTLFAGDEATIRKFAYLDQDLATCDPTTNDNNAVTNCKQLNGAAAYFNAGLVEMKILGTHIFGSTRNNDFSNRSQKARIIVLIRSLLGWEIALLVSGLVLAALIIVYIGIVVFAFKHPKSFLFSKRFRQRCVRCWVPRRWYEEKVEIRKAWKDDQKIKLAAIIGKDQAWKEDVRTVSDSDDGSLATTADGKEDHFCAKLLHKVGLSEGQRMTVVLLLLLNLIAALAGFLLNLNNGFNNSLAFPFAKAGGFALDLDMAILILPTLKSLQTAIRGKGGKAREWVPLDDPIELHITVAYLVVFFSLLHIISHFLHMRAIALAEPLYKDPLNVFGLTSYQMIAGLDIATLLIGRSNITGLMITIIMVTVYITAMPCVRRGTLIFARKLGGFNVFMRVHKVWPLLYILLLIHGSDRFWVFMFFPFLCIVFDRLLLWQRRRYPLCLKTAHLLAGDVMHLNFQLPDTFVYQAGQYVMINWKGEWHPFTLTSAPEEATLSVHIRASSNMDWCFALRRELFTEAPVAVRDGYEAIKDAKEVAMGTIIEFENIVLPNGLTVSRPRKLGDVADLKQSYAKPTLGVGKKGGEREAPPLALGVAAPPPQMKKAATDESELFGDLRTLLPGAITLQLQGPFGAPAQRVWEFRTIMVVGAGIGVTPFASILRSVQMRVQQRTLLGAKPTSFQDKTPKVSANNKTPIESLLKSVIPVPRRIHFYWIVRDQKELDWFLDLLNKSVQGPAQDIIEVNVFTTGEIELSQVKKLDCTSHQFFGRPNWARIFKANKQKHKGEHIGVFLCGSPVIGDQLRTQSKKHSDPITAGPDRTRFSFFTEHF